MSSVVVDTHAAIWYLSVDPRISAPAIQAMEKAVQSGDPIYVPSICLVEATYLVEKGRLPQIAFDLLVRAIGRAGSGFVIASLDGATALALGQVRRESVPDMPDRIIAATALSLGLPLVTRDGRIRASGIQTIW